MVDHDELVAVFSVPGVGFPVPRADPALLAGSALTDAAQRVLVEVGLPGGIGVDAVFDDLTASDGLMKAIAAGHPDRDHRLLPLGIGVDSETILLDGVTGEVFARHSERNLRVSSSLGLFVESLYFIQRMVNEEPGRRWVSQEDTQQLCGIMMARLTELDPPALAEAKDWWEEFFHHAY